MRRVFFLIILLCAFSMMDTLPVWSETININIGTIEVPNGFHHQRTGTKDSERGVITSPQGLTLNYDIGRMAGTHMYSGLQKDCLWYREQFINGRDVISGIINRDGKKQLIITIREREQAKGVFQSPANFWADTKRDEDIAEVILIALSYSPN